MYGSSYYGSYGYGSGYGSRYSSGYGSGYGYGSYGYRYGSWSRPYYSTDDSGYYYGSSRRRRYAWERDHARYSGIGGRTESPSPPPAPPKPEPPKEVFAKLMVEKVDLNIEENTKEHNTDKYWCCSDDAGEDRELVVRRGGQFKVTITFDRPYNIEKNDLQLMFSIGPDKLADKGQKVQFEVDESAKSFKDGEKKKWGAKLESQSGNDATLLINVPADTIVGEWNFSVVTSSKDKDGDEPEELKFKYNHDTDITILFNAWCKDDTVFLEKQLEREEYVLNDSGCLFRGNGMQIGAKPWNFGQFEEKILDAALTLLRMGFKGSSKLKQMANPVMVTRRLAAMVNDKKVGVLVGNWSGNYSDGTSPTKWSGSRRILRQWLENGPVKYGQCWVFSAVYTTICRALGIPCRSVTCFSSAHDTNQTNCIEKFYDENGKELKNWNTDSVWNFHVWNECWMTRPDLIYLKKGMEFLRRHGWQVADATPQELSDGVYTCGPCPVEAVYRGYCIDKYDTGFVFSEVNADEVRWTVGPGYEFTLKDVSRKKIGTCICTKVCDGLPFKDSTYGVGGFRFDREAYDRKKRLDLTGDYKPKEGSQEERDAVKQALDHANYYVQDYIHETVEEHWDMEFHLLHDNSTMTGSDLKIQLTAKNNGKNNVKILAADITVKPQTYTGPTGDNEIQYPFSADDAFLRPGEETIFTALLKHEDYLPKIQEQAHFLICGTATYWVSEANKKISMTKEHKFRFRRPDLEVTCKDSARKGEKVEFEVTFKNPLDIPLTNCTMSVDSVGLEDFKDVRVNDVPALAEYKQTFPLLADRVKKSASVAFSFDSAQLKDISGSSYIDIER